MGHESRHSSPWALAKAQHGVITRRQLANFGINDDGIQHRVSRGRLYRVIRGVYAVGRPELTREGRWMAAVLACGEDAALSHDSAAVLWGMRRHESAIHVSAPHPCTVRHPRLQPHRRTAAMTAEITHVRAIPVTQPLFTLIDLAAHVGERELEEAINAADTRGLVDAGSLGERLSGIGRRRGRAQIRQLLERYQRTDSDLERHFLRLVKKAGLPIPQTQQRVNGYRVDFYWPGLGLVVETDGLTYHRTPTQQIRDRERDQAHTRAGLTNLRFANVQIREDPDTVIATLRAVVS